MVRVVFCLLLGSISDILTPIVRNIFILQGLPSVTLNVKMHICAGFYIKGPNTALV